MSYKFAEHLLLRMPVKSWSSFDGTDFQDLLNDQHFLSAVYIASPGFYTRLARVGFKYKSLNAREHNTVRKYHNRICFRPTPFGLFSSISLIKWGDGADLKMTDAACGYKPCINPDQSYIMAIGNELLNNELSCTGLFSSNPTLYRAGKEYRFIRTDLDANFKTRNYDLQSTDYSPFMKNLVQFCGTGRQKREIIDYITVNAGCTEEDGEGYFQFMADSQLLVNNLRPNINGTDHLQRLLKQVQKTEPGNLRLPVLRQVQECLSSTTDIVPETFMQLNKALMDTLPEHLSFVQDEQLSVILKNDAVEGNLALNYQQQLSDAIFALDILIQEEQPKALGRFIKTFKKQFDQQCIPLLKVLDPEIGIGYQAPDQNAGNPLLETLNVRKRPPEDTVKWTAVHRYLLDCWHNQPIGELPVLRLKEGDLLKLKKDDTSPKILGASILFRVVNNCVIIETAGGINAPALLGRFTVTDEQMAKAARKMAAEVEAANPDVIFAETVHLSDSHVDNINRREHIWSKELPVTAASLLKDEDQIHLDDLYVSVENEQVILRSAKHKKVVIPRLTSAYNYNLNKLPLFYFLGDVQYQYSKSHFTLDMRYYFPGLSFYPRVEYKSAVLHLATWVLNKEEIAALSIENEQQLFADFYSIALRLRLPQVFSLVQGDQQLVFYRERESDILLLAESIKNKSEVVLKEYLQDDKTNSIVKDGRGDGYISQFNAFLYSQEPILPNSKRSHLKQPAQVKRDFVLGSEWLYLKIYVPKIAISGLMLKIKPLLKRTYKHGGIKKWFFIRYEDHAPHIRLRLKIAPEDLGEVLLVFKQKLEKSIYQHVIREYQADTYNREMERYQAGNYDQTEDFFWRSSELVMQFYRMEKLSSEQASPHLFALFSARDLLDVFMPDKTEQLQFTQLNYQQFMLEFDDKKIAFELDKKYRELSKSINSTLRDSAFYRNLSLKAAAANFIRSAQVLAQSMDMQEGVSKSFLSAIIHMHLNRIFVDEPRKQEMIVYYFLNKYLISDIARRKHA